MVQNGSLKMKVSVSKSFRDQSGQERYQKSHNPIGCETDTDRESETSESVSKLVPGLIRLVLGRSASEALTAAGERAFAIVGRASYPEDPSRWVIHLAPVDFPAAQDACEVLLGTKRAIRPRKPKSPSSESAS